MCPSCTNTESRENESNEAPFVTAMEKELKRRDQTMKLTTIKYTPLDNYQKDPYGSIIGLRNNNI